MTIKNQWWLKNRTKKINCRYIAGAAGWWGEKVGWEGGERGVEENFRNKNNIAKKKENFF